MSNGALEVQIAVAKVGKYATSESGDTMEMAERPHGGLSLVLVDGQQSGKGAKAISSLVARKALSLLAEGVRDGAAARAAHDYLYTHRHGKVQATLNIVSVDLVSKTVVLSRNSHCPVVLVNQGQVTVLDEPSTAVGIYPHTKPAITEVPITPALCVVVFTDGVLSAGQRYGQQLDVVPLIQSHLADRPRDAQALADALLGAAVSLDRGRPSDDISVLVVNIVPSDSESEVRRMKVSFPILGGWETSLNLEGSERVVTLG